MGVHQARTRPRASRGPKPHSYQSPLDHAKAHELDWGAVADVFDAARRITNPSFVYFIVEQDGPIKIGLAKDPIKRLRGMQTGNSRRLRLEHVLVGDRETEGLLHELWEPDAIRSATKRNGAEGYTCTEWFDPSVRNELFHVADVAAEAQIKYIVSASSPSFHDLSQIVFDAHVDCNVDYHQRDERIFLAAGAGYTAKNFSTVKNFDGSSHDRAGRILR